MSNQGQEVETVEGKSRKMKGRKWGPKNLDDGIPWSIRDAMGNVNFLKGQMLSGTEPIPFSPFIVLRCLIIVSWIKTCMGRLNFRIPVHLLAYE